MTKKSRRIREPKKSKKNDFVPMTEIIAKIAENEQEMVEASLLDDDLDDTVNDIWGSEFFDFSGDFKDAKDKHRVTLIQDHCLTYPDLWMDVYLHGPAFEKRAFADMFARSHCRKKDSPDEADLVVFVGGVDVDPALYGEVAHKSTVFIPERDASDIELYKHCLAKGIPMLGICRGAQFLHVMNGGKLFQDVDNHVGDHSIYDLRLKETITKVSSVHHQMVRPGPVGLEVIATSGKSRNRYKNDQESQIGPNADIEAFFYRETCCLGIQGHPEYANYSYFTIWVLKKIEDCVLNNPDIELSRLAEGPAYRRMLPALIEMRESISVPNPILQLH